MHVSGQCRSTDPSAMIFMGSYLDAAEDYSHGTRLSELRRRCQGCSVLVADDDVLVHELVHMVLGDLVCRVECVTDGDLALQAVTQHQYDLVFMDIRMPRLDGITATRLIRSLGGEYVDTPILAMTSDVYSSRLLAYQEAGMTDCLGKPLSKTKILQALDVWLPLNTPTLPPDVQTAVEAEISRLRGRFLETLHGELEKLDTALSDSTSDGDRNAVFQASAHRLAGLAPTFGLAELGDHASRLDHKYVNESKLAKAELVKFRNAVYLAVEQSAGQS